MSDEERSYPDVVRSLTQAVRDGARAVAKAERERDEARAERDRAVDQANNIAAEWIVTERERDEARATLDALPDLLREDSPEGDALRERLGLSVSRGVAWEAGFPRPRRQLVSAWWEPQR